MAGLIISASSEPNKPLSLACGFKPNTAIFGFSIQKSFFKLSLISFNLLVIFSLVIAAGTSFTGIWPVTTPTRRPSQIRNISTSLLPLFSCRYSVWLGKANVSDWILCLLIGAVTRASISPFTRSAVARSNDKSAYLPPVGVTWPSSIFTSSSQQLIMFALFACAWLAWLITLKLKSPRLLAFLWKDETLVWP
ncbi:hypothetical protein D3C73_958620 [compost metagenome]